MASVIGQSYCTPSSKCLDYLMPYQLRSWYIYIRDENYVLAGHWGHLATA